MTIYPVLPRRLFIAGNSARLLAHHRAGLVGMLQLRHVVNLWHLRDDDWANHGVTYTHLPVSDGKAIAPALLDLAAVVTGYVQRDEPTLIQCHAGANRSALLAGLVMRELGMEDVVTAIRAVRGATALNNAAFAAYLGEGG